ncbi:MAG: glycosyltransferase [Lentisphaerae bacterium]|nr:glycosyltransferase [Lentisphaerota bacterium]
MFEWKGSERIVTAEQIQKGKVVIFSHYATTGACEELRDWLVGMRVRELAYVAFPFGPNPDRFIRTDVYRDGRLFKTTRSLFRIRLPEPLAYAKDFLYAITYAMRVGCGADLLVAGDNLLSLAGCLASRIARIKRVAYYMIDYTPVRYANRLLNGLYYWVDRQAACRADVVWPLTEEMIQGRFNAGRLDRRRVRWYVVPYGCHAVSSASYDVRNVVYMGDIVQSKGADLFIPFANALRRMVPAFRFTIIGGGRDLAGLKAEAERAGLRDQVTFHGFLAAIGDVVALVARGGVAIAPYDPSDANSFTFYSDPGKVKVYLGCGLPVVLTDVPPIARVIAREGAGRIARYDATDLAETVASVMRSAEYSAIRARASAMGHEYEWRRIFENAFDQLNA